MVSKGFAGVKPENLVNWDYRITNNELYQIIEAISFEEYQEPKQLKQRAHVNRRENDDIL